MARFYLITCDDCGAESPMADTRSEAAHLSRADGWTLKGQGGYQMDRCPSCAGARKPNRVPG